MEGLNTEASVEAMEHLSGFPFFPVEFDKTAKPVKPQQIDDLKTALGDGAFTDLLVISHGWNNDIKDARNLYERFLQTARQLLDSGDLPAAAARAIAVLGVFWPSKKFAEKDLIPGGAAGVEGVDVGALRANLQDLHGVFDAPEADQALSAMEALAPRLEDSDRACAEFVTLARGLLKGQAVDDADGSTLFFDLPPEDVFEKLKQPVSYAEPAPSGSEAVSLALSSGMVDGEGGAAGLGAVFSGIGSAAGNVLNLVTYYQMKERAGLVGRVGLNPLLRSLRQLQPNLRLHLVGHSFGGRLVTAAIAGDNATALLPVDSLALLQAAYSHYGLAQRWDGKQDGVFRPVLSGNALRGPGVITHTVNDKAVGLAYPLASLLAGQVAAGLGDANDKYGGLGRNGAQQTPEAQSTTLKEVGTAYGFQAGKLYNLRADAYVKGHGDITGPEVVHAVFQAMG